MRSGRLEEPESSHDGKQDDRDYKEQRCCKQQIIGIKYRPDEAHLLLSNVLS
jgi:hypothetical protein